MADTELSGASFPGAVVGSPTFQQRATGEIVEAEHMNAVQAEVIKVESTLGVNPHTPVYPNTGSPEHQAIVAAYNVDSPVTATTVSERIAKAEIAITRAGRHPLDTAAHGAQGAVVGTTNVQTLTNKTLVDPTIQGNVSGNMTFTGDVNFTGTVGLTAGNIPIGGVIMHIGTSTPVGFVEFGVTISKTGCTCSSRGAHSHEALFAELGLGAATTFAVPAMTDNVPRGGTPLLAGGADSVTIGTTNLPAHAHDMGHGHTFNIAASGAHEHEGDYMGFEGLYEQKDGWDLIRPRSRDTYSTRGVWGFSIHGGKRPTVTTVGGAHSHTANLQAYAGNTGNAGGGQALSVVPKHLGFRFLIRG